MDAFFSDKDIDVDWNLGAAVWRTAGARYGAYARDRRRQRGDTGPRRILADFLIGAHAFHLANALLTSDTRIYGTYFADLKVVSPANPTQNKPASSSPDPSTRTGGSAWGGTGSSTG